MRAAADDQRGRDQTKTLSVWQVLQEADSFHAPTIHVPPLHVICLTLMLMGGREGPCMQPAASRTSARRSGPDTRTAGDLGGFGGSGASLIGRLAVCSLIISDGIGEGPRATDAPPSERKVAVSRH